MPKSAKVVLGGVEYVVEQLPIRAARAWREALSRPFGEITAALEGADRIELTDASELAGLVQGLSGTLIGSVDMLMEMLFDYSPVLAQDRERIEAEAYDDEALTAFVEVLKLAYPFGQLLALVSGRTGSKTSLS